VCVYVDVTGIGAAAVAVKYGVVIVVAVGDCVAVGHVVGNAVSVVGVAVIVVVITIFVVLLFTLLLCVVIFSMSLLLLLIAVVLSALLLDCR